MGIFEHFPYTNFHDLNLDWILYALKEMSGELQGIDEKIKTAVDKALDDKNLEQIVRDVLAEQGLVDIKSFGAVGDGQTDDADAFQRAVNSETAKGIYISAGHYKIGHPITVTHNDLLIMGAGGVIDVDNDNPHFYFITFAEGVHYTGLNFTGTSLPNNFVTDAAIHVGTRQSDAGMRKFNVLIDNCHFENIALRAVNLYSFTSSYLPESVCESVKVNACTFVGRMTAGIILSGVRYVTVSNCFAETETSVEFSSIDNHCEYITYSGNEINSNGGGAAVISTDDSNVFTLDGNVIRQINMSLPAITCNRETGTCDNLIISNNEIIGGSAGILFPDATSEKPYVGIRAATVTGNDFTANVVPVRIEAFELALIFGSNIYRDGLPYYAVSNINKLQSIVTDWLLVQPVGSLLNGTYFTELSASNPSTISVKNGIASLHLNVNAADNLPQGTPVFATNIGEVLPVPPPVKPQSHQAIVGYHQRGLANTITMILTPGYLNVTNAVEMAGVMRVDWSYPYERLY